MAGMFDQIQLLCFDQNQQVRLKALETMLMLAEINEIRPLIMKAVEVNFREFK